MTESEPLLPEQQGQSPSVTRRLLWAREPVVGWSSSATEEHDPSKSESGSRRGEDWGLG